MNDIFVAAQVMIFVQKGLKKSHNSEKLNTVVEGISSQKIIN
jgi:hypothetical protein